MISHNQFHRFKFLILVGKFLISIFTDLVMGIFHIWSDAGAPFRILLDIMCCHFCCHNFQWNIFFFIAHRDSVLFLVNIMWNVCACGKSRLDGFFSTRCGGKKGNNEWFVESGADYSDYERDDEWKNPGKMYHNNIEYPIWLLTFLLNNKSQWLP